ncbi:MAG TPA: DoxX family protein [Pirellulaceae bacterium]|jgi:uncharacterized membrane protein YphA (DoxX/SURF4 family)|nr:DoxX family protein [Pirellulaceae bacterium]
MTRGETIAMWIGRILTALIGLLLIASGISKFVMGGPEFEAQLAESGMPKELLPVIGTIEIVVALLYLFPPTSLLGAILVVGYMGGAIFAHMRLGEPWIAQAIIPLLAGLGVYLREPRLWSLLPVRTFRRSDAALEKKSL